MTRRLYDAQKLRIQSSLRIQRLIREEIVLREDAEKDFEKAHKLEVEAEEEYARIVWREAKDIPIVKGWLGRVKGIGPRLSGLLVANIAPVARFANVSKLWAYAGLHTVPDGKGGWKAARREKGRKANWNDELKTTCWKIAQSFVKTGGPYREVYDAYKKRIIAREIGNGNVIWQTTAAGKVTVAYAPKALQTQELKPPIKPEWTLGRINNMGLRKTSKLFLSHLWHVWREMEGLSTEGPYVFDRLHHETYVDPWSMLE